MEKIKELEHESIIKLLVKYSTPSFIALLVNSIYNIVDRAFVGRYLGEEALAGLTVGFPILLVIFATSVLIARGGGNLISISLGKKDYDEANRVFSTTISVAVIASIILSIIGYLSLNFTLKQLTNSDAVFFYAKEYLSIVYLGIIMQLIAFTLNVIVRFEGFAVLSMTSMILSALANIILDYIFIAKMGLGVRSAALATFLGQSIGFFILVSHFLKKKSMLRVKSKIPDLKLTWQIAKIGAPSYMITFGNGAAMLALTAYLSRLGGTAALASFGVIMSITNIFNMVSFGIQNGMQPIIAYNYGAKQFNRVNSTLLYSLILNTTLSLLLLSIIYINPEFFIKIFLKSESSIITTAANSMKIYLSAFIFVGINLLGIGYFQSTSQAKQSVLLSSLRQIVVLFPVLFILSELFGLKGVWAVRPVTDLISGIIVIIVLVKAIRKEKLKKELKYKKT